MSKSIAIVAQHQYLLEFSTCADSKFENVLFGFGSNSLEVCDGIADGDS